MNTTAAAVEASVTVATIRYWCRYGAVAAVKQAGRWVIDAASLAARIAIGKERRMNTSPVTLTVENLTAIGGHRWQKNGKDRIYINGWEQYAGIEITRYKSGNISSFCIDGRAVANSRAAKILGAVSTVYFDVVAGQLRCVHYDAHEVEVKYLDGERDEIDLIEMIDSGIRAAVAAL